MKELHHHNHQYEGNAGEQVVVTITAVDTTHMVHYVLDGVLPSKVLPAGTPLRFNLKNQSGAQTPLQLDMDFNAKGSYEIVVETVVDCVKDPQQTGKCRHKRKGPPRVIENYQFFVL